MKKRHLALATGVVLVLIGLAIAVTTVRLSVPLTVRCSKVAPFESALMVTLQVSNNTTRALSVLPVRLERYEGGTWRKCPDGEIISTEIGDPMRLGSVDVFCLIRSQLPHGHLRFVMNKVTARQGLNSFPGRVWLWLSGKNKTVPLKPLDNAVLLHTDPAEMIVEFVAP